ncbi:MAG: LLM class flavin-dependent oxidoreductase, partial [Nitrospinota bacterium]|nr:LLM class flavin-dependent oxidoreductase [Nitrospinota bacterium]
MTNRPTPHFGLLLPNDGYPVVDFDHLRTLAREAEALDFDSAWVADHFLAPPGLSAAFGTKGIFEATLVLAALSSVTERIALGTSVLLFPMRHPIHLANLISTLDHATKGRLILGFGVGGHRPEFDACGVPYAKRGGMTNEALEILNALFTQDNVSYEGKHYQFENVSFEPKPYTPGGPPIVSGGDVGKTLERVAKHARGWMPWGGRIDQMTEGMAAVKARAAELGRDPEEMLWGVGFYGCCTRDKDVIRHELDKIAPYFTLHHDEDLSPEELADKTLIGTPEDIVRRLERFLDIGVNHFIVKHLP